MNDGIYIYIYILDFVEMNFKSTNEDLSLHRVTKSGAMAMPYSTFGAAGGYVTYGPQPQEIPHDRP